MNPLQIHSLEQLEMARVNKRAVVAPSWSAFSRPRPAAWIINLSGPVLLSLMRSGLFIYTPPSK
ncbi:MAG: hypothetical protein JWO82_4227 [Akkermansiaceae bacterium]|nr:hypothetical protein [Akkermansiaceae bacterium]